MIINEPEPNLSPYHSQLDGILTAQHVPGLIGMGDTLAVVATVTASP